MPTVTMTKIYDGLPDKAAVRRMADDIAEVCKVEQFAYDKNIDIGDRAKIIVFTKWVDDEDND